MNLRLAYRILSKAEAQPSGSLKVRGRRLVHEVQEMATAGLVNADKTAATDPVEAVITRITHAGHHFYRAFRNRRTLSFG